MTDQAEKKHSAFWGVMVIAGTVIGGGMFALPVDLAGAWFFWGAFILIIAWFASFRVVVIRSKFKLSRRLQF